MKFDKNNQVLIDYFQSLGNNPRLAIMIGITNYTELEHGFSGELQVTVDSSMDHNDLIGFLKMALEMAENAKITASFISDTRKVN